MLNVEKQKINDLVRRRLGMGCVLAIDKPCAPIVYILSVVPVLVHCTVVHAPI